MENKKLLYVVLIIAIVALALGIFATYYAVKTNQQISAIKVSVDEMQETTDAFEPLMPQIEGLKTLLPRIKTFLLGVPPENL
jgi:cell division protein FtsL